MGTRLAARRVLTPGRRGSAALVIVALILCLPDAGEPASRKKWFQATTRGFVVTSDGGEAGTRRIARHFATIHEVFQAAFPSMVPEDGARVPVLGVRGRSAMRDILGPRPTDVAGALRSGPLRSDILIRSDLLGQEALTTVQHEYVHLVLRRNAPHIPLWLSEGLAETWGDLDVSGEQAKAGRPRRRHLETLRGRVLIPLDELMSADHLSELYQAPTLKPVFYAQSWAMTHYLMVGEGRERYPNAVERYAGLVGSGAGPVEAAERLFGDLGELKEELRRYLRAFKLPYLILTLPPSSEQEIEVRRLSEGESLTIRAEFMPFSRGREVARGLFEKALETSPAIAAAHQGLGFLDLRDREDEAAASRFERALELDPSLWLSHYGRAVATAPSTGAAAATVAEEHLRRALELRPGASPALCRLGALLARSNERAPAGLEMVRQAIAMEPETNTYRLAEVSLLESSGAPGAARAALERLLDRARRSGSAQLNNNLCWYGALSGFAARVLPACDLACSITPKEISSRDSRGLARAIAGDLEGAIEDFRFVLRSNRERPPAFYRTRAAWLRTLEAGRSPFGPAEREDLRRETSPWGCYLSAS